MGLKQVVSNLFGQEPFPTKVRLVVKNMLLIKVARLRLCCGNHGQAGC